MDMFKVLINGLWQFANIHIHIDSFEIKLYYIPLFIWINLTLLKMIYGPTMELTYKHIQERAHRQSTAQIGRDIIKNWGKKEVAKK
jgi:hypothetical protein